MARKNRNAPATVADKHWQVAAYALVAAAALAAVLTVSNAGLPGETPDAATAADARYAELHQALPARATLGYVSDMGGNNMAANGPFFQAQYALAPVLLQPGTGPELIVGNFSSPAAIEAALQQHRVAVVRDFGNGVLVLKKAAQ